jgi:hypothetical protein
MKFIRLSFAIAIGALPLHALAVDFTPRFSDTFVNGVVTRRLFFVDGERKIGVFVGNDTTVEAGGGGAVLRVPALPDLILVLRPSPMAADQPFQGVSFERYREAARRLLPPGSARVKALAENAEPITINGWHSFRFVYSFETANAYRMQSVTFVNLDDGQQITLITASKESNFEEASARAWQIIRTWHPLPPSQ